MSSSIVLLMLLMWLGCTAAMTLRAGRATRERQETPKRVEDVMARITGAPMSASVSTQSGGQE